MTMRRILVIAAALLLMAGCHKEDSDHREPPVVGAVDLGLSVDWAVCNLGADNAWEYGNYYSWGETSPKSDYRWPYYVFWLSGDMGNVKLKKYVNSVTYGNIDGRLVLDASDDAARSKGGSWRMPTSNEIQELIDNCTWTWTTLNDVNGYEVRSNKNDGSIFIPAAGDMAGTTLDTEGRRCCIWSSGLFQGNCATAESLVADKGKVEVSNFARCYGLSIRPVYVYDK